jgi:hypothetical protein
MASLVLSFAKFPWLRASVPGMGMLLIEEKNDLGPAIELAAQG